MRFNIFKISSSMALRLARIAKSINCKSRHFRYQSSVSVVDPRDDQVVRILLSRSSAESFRNISTNRTSRSQDLVRYHSRSGVWRKSIDVSNNVKKKLMRFLPDNEIFETADLPHELTHFLTNSLTP